MTKNSYVTGAVPIVCSEKRTVFRERNARNTVNFKEQIMSKDKYPSTFSCQMEAIAFIILQIFLAAQTVWKIGEYHLDILQFFTGTCSVA